MFEYSLTILEKHLDTFGHVNNAVYLQLLEEARWDFITKGGFGLDRIQREKKGPVVLQINIRYRRELLNREKITIVSKPSAEVGKIMHIQQDIIKENGDPAAEAQITIGFMDMKARKLIEPEAQWLQAIGIKK